MLQYEYVHYDICKILPSLKSETIGEARNSLINLMRILIDQHNIVPEVSAKNIGFKKGVVKYFLNIQNIQLKEIPNKK